MYPNHILLQTPNNYMKLYIFILLFFIGINQPIDAQFSLQIPSIAQASAGSASVKQAYLYPNPTAEFFSVANETEVQKISIINLLGKTIREFEPAANGKYAVAELPRGMYMVRIEYENKNTITVRLNKVNP